MAVAAAAGDAGPPEAGEAAAAAAEEALQRLWEGAGEKKSLDPPGFVRELTGSEAEAAEFVERWRGLGLPMDAALMEAVLGDLQSADPDSPVKRKA